jgi:hypothetical protein
MASKRDVGAGSAAYRTPMTPAQRAELAKELESREVLGDKPVEMSEEEREAAEKEKAALLAEMKQNTDAAKTAAPKPEARPRRQEEPAVVVRDRLRPEIEEIIDSSSPLTLAVRAKKIQERVTANAQLGHTEIDIKKQATIDRLAPLVARATETLVAVKALFNHKETLEFLAPLGWADAPSEWPVKLRMRAQEKVFAPAAKLLGQFSSTLNNIPKTIAEAERVMGIGYWKDSSWPSVVTQVEWEIGQLSRTADVIASLTMDLRMLEQELERVDEQAQDYKGAKQPEVVILLDGASRTSRVAEALERAEHGELQERAEGVSDPI